MAFRGQRLSSAAESRVSDRDFDKLTTISISSPVPNHRHCVRFRYQPHDKGPLFLSQPALFFALGVAANIGSIQVFDPQALVA